MIKASELAEILMAIEKMLPLIQHQIRLDVCDDLKAKNLTVDGGLQTRRSRLTLIARICSKLATLRPNF